MDPFSALGAIAGAIAGKKAFDKLDELKDDVIDKINPQCEPTDLEVEQLLKSDRLSSKQRKALERFQDRRAALHNGDSEGQARWDALIKAGYTARDIANM